VVVGSSAAGNIEVQLTHEGDLFLASKVVGSLSGALTSTDFEFERTVTGGSNNLGGSVVSILDTSSSSGTINPDMLFINAALTSGTYTGNLIRAQVGGTDKLVLSASSGLTLSGDSAMTTNSVTTINGSTYVHTTGETGSLMSLAFTDASTNASSSATTTGLYIASTLNTSGAGSKTINGIYVDRPTLTGCASGNCSWSGLRVSTATTGVASNITQYGAYVDGRGVSAGSVYGLYIPSITPDAGTEKAIFIGPGWDSAVSLTFTTATSSTTIRGLQVQYNSSTNSSASAAESSGLEINNTGSTLVQNNASGSTLFYGVKIGLPTIQGTSGSIASTGLQITTNLNITSGTQKGLEIIAIGQSVGSITGINISSITAGAGTEYAMSIGTGWDAALRVGSNNILNGSGVLQSAGLSGTYSNSLTLSSTSNVLAASTFTAGSGGNTVTIDPSSGTSGLLYAGSARPTKTITLSPEYPGATFTTDSTGTNNGSLTSDNTGSGSSFRNYYEWSSTQASLQDYTIAVRVTLPQDFSDWATTGFSLEYQTGTATATDNAVSAKIYEASQTTAACDLSTDRASTSWATTNMTCAGSTLNDGTNDWDTAGQVGIIKIKVRAKNTASALARIGDITLSYKAKF
jgi:hypothetical protein